MEILLRGSAEDQQQLESLAYNPQVHPAVQAVIKNARANIKVGQIPVELQTNLVSSSGGHCVHLSIPPRTTRPSY